MTPLPVAGQSLAGRYELVETIATGGMATVWRARDTVLGREVAVKVLHPHLATDRGFLLRFRREAVAAARLSHPSIVSIYDTVSDDGTEAIVMELIHGRTLRSILDEIGVLSERDAVDLGLQISDALTEAHRAGVVHRDIKPSNILLCADRRVVVTDFGIAKAGEDTDLTVTGTLLGTAKYLAPEQVSGDAIDPRADLYALGIVLFECLTGQAPFKADTDAATALARLHQPPPRAQTVRPDLSDDLDAVIHRLMSRSPSARYRSAVELRAALSAVTFGPDPHDATLVVAGDQLAADRGSAAAGNGVGSTSADRGRPAGPLGDDIEADPEGDAFDDDDLDDESPGFLRSERSWMLPAFALLLTAAALVVAVQLFAQSPLASNVDPEGETVDSTQPDDDTDTTLLNITTPVDPVIAAATALDDPSLGGDGEENEALVPNAYDGDPDTSWRTDTYRRPNYGLLKPGVGFLVEFEARSQVREVELETNSENWTIEIYVGTSFGTDPQSWGDPVAVIIDGDGRERVDVDAVGDSLLLWITDHGLSDDGSDDNEEDDHRFELAEIVIR